MVNSVDIHITGASLGHLPQIFLIEIFLSVMKTIEVCIDKTFATQNFTIDRTVNIKITYKNQNSGEKEGYASYAFQKKQKLQRQKMKAKMTIEVSYKTFGVQCQTISSLLDLQTFGHIV